MNKYILAVFLTLTLSINAFALTPLPVEDQISNLRAEIARLTALVRQLGGDPNPTPILPYPIFCYEFKENFTPGDGHPDWTKLGEVLKLEGVTTVKQLQEKYEADTLRPAGLRLGTGYVGPLTRAKLNALYRCAPPIHGDSLPPSISGVTGPTMLKIGELGTWTINASDPGNDPLSYSVHWGDEPLSSAEVGTTPSAERVYSQTATFTHTYSRAGTYYPKFWVRDNAGNTQWTSLSVNVTAGNVARVTVTSPNGGESWVANSIERIRWSTVNTNRNDKVDIYLDKIPVCLPSPYPCSNTIVLDKNISASASYNWIVATDISDNTILAGDYYMKVCLAGTNNCDVSDRPFTITDTTLTPTITPTQLPLPVVSADKLSQQPIKVNGFTGENKVEWKIVSGALPENVWLERNTTFCIPEAHCPDVENFMATIGGWPAAEGEYNFTVQASNGSQVARQAYKLTVAGWANSTPELQLVSPNGGEAWPSRSVKRITWSLSNGAHVEKVNIFLDQKGVAKTYTLDKNIPISQIYNWIVATDIDDKIIPAGDYYMRICSSSAAAFCGRSDSSFAITLQ